MKKQVFAALSFVLFIIHIMAFTVISLAAESDVVPESNAISYENLIRYKELYDPDVGYGPGNVPVIIEAIVVGVDTTHGLSMDMFLRGDRGYYFYRLWINEEDITQIAILPEAIMPMQRINIEVTPFSDGTFYSSNVKSIQIIEQNVSVEELMITAEEVETMNLSSDESISGLIEVIIGDLLYEGSYDNVYDVWIKGQNSFVKNNMKLSFDVEKGQRWYFGVTPYKGSVYSDIWFTSYRFLVEENIDLQPFEEAYLASDPITKHLLEPFDSSNFAELSYKKILRDLSASAGSAVLIEGQYRQNLGAGSALMSDNKGNYYHLDIREGVIETKLLEKDHIRVYGYVLSTPYEYTSWTGDKTIPDILVRHIDLLEED